MKQGKRLFSVLLTLVMLLALLPSGAARADNRGTEGYLEIESWKLISQAVARSCKIRLKGNAVASDASTGPIVISGVDVTIDLNGFQLDRNLQSPLANGSVIKVIDGGSLTVEDSKGGGMITGGNTTGNGGGIYAEFGKLTLNGGRIYGNYASFGEGGGVYICDNSEFSIKKGDITRNEARYGGGVFIEGPAGWVEMSGGAIANNYALIGGAVYVWHGTFDMSGGLITGNYFLDIGQYDDLLAYPGVANGLTNSVIGAVVVNSAGGAIDLSGKVIIRGNEGNDLVLTGFREDEFMLITLSFSGNTMDRTSIVGVSKCLVSQPAPENDPPLLMFSGWIGGAITAGTDGGYSEENFFCENGYLVRKNVTDGELELVDSSFGICCDDEPQSSSLGIYVNNPPEKIIAMLIAAWYDSEGVLLGTKVLPVTTEETAFYRLERPNEAGGAECYKIFLLARYTLEPLCDACAYGVG
ncbi:MAG: hypothetical protein J5449_04465 [Oscillospiraceae bacterium]|nr:hypothetical protein [Oscillospiraceae bacterium]